MFNLTKQEKLVLCFIGLAAIFGIGVDFYSKHIHNLQTQIHLKININQATKEELIKLDGIGPVLAERIIKYRTQYGPFKKREEIMRVYGIGENKFQIIKNNLTVN